MAVSAWRGDRHRHCSKRVLMEESDDERREKGRKKLSWDRKSKKKE
jgi:hypothetical protein